MKFSQMLKARNLTLEHQAMLKTVGAVVVVLDEDVTRVAGYNAAESLNEILRLQCGSALVYGYDDLSAGSQGAFDLNRLERYWILAYQRRVNMQEYGPFHWAHYDAVSRVVDSRGRSARGRKVEGSRVHLFSPNSGQDQKYGEELLRLRGIHL